MPIYPLLNNTKQNIYFKIEEQYLPNVDSKIESLSSFVIYISDKTFQRKRKSKEN